MTDEWDKKTALNKAARFCAYQERSPREVKDKLATRISNPAIIQEIVNELKEEGFIDEERFVASFIKGRFYQKKWGPVKIRYALLRHQIDEQLVREQMDLLIPEDDYLATVLDLMEKKIRRIGKADPLVIKGKVFQHLAGKGYDQDIIYTAWNTLGYNV